MFMAEAVQVIRVTVSTKIRKAAAVNLRPDTHTHTHTSNSKSHYRNFSPCSSCVAPCVSLTNYKIDNAAEDRRGDATQKDFSQDLGQEVDRCPVVSADVLMSIRRNRKNIRQQCSVFNEFLSTDVCTRTQTVSSQL